MLIEILENVGNVGDPELHILRLYKFDMQEAKYFYDDISHVKETHADLHLGSRPYCSRVNCDLIFRWGAKNKGVERVEFSNTFICELNNEGYQLMLDRVYHFTTAEINGYNWLHEELVPTELLFSPGGSW